MRHAFVLATTVMALSGQTTVEDLLERKVVDQVRRLEESMGGVLGFAAIDLNTGRGFSYRGDVVFPQASSIKIPILIEVFRAERRGELRLADRVKLTASDSVGGSGVLQRELAKAAADLTVRQLAVAMIEHSDNTATNKLIAIVGMDKVNRMLDEFGFLSTRLRRRMIDPAAAARNEENVSTPVEMARLVELLYRGKIIDERACAEMVDIMKLVKAGMRRAIPAEIEVASKPGGLAGVQCETGIAYLKDRPFVLSVAGTFLDEKDQPVQQVTRAVYAYFEKLSGANRYGHAVGTN